MHILIATPLYPPEIGGPATDAAALVAGLEADGVGTTVYPFQQVRRYPRIVRHVLYMVGLIIRGRKASCIVVFDTMSVGLPSALAAGFLRIPFVVRVPGDYAWEQGTQRFGVRDSIEDFQRKRYGIAIETLRATQRFVVQRAALVLVPSDYFLSVVSFWGVQSTRLKRIYLGLPLDTASASIITDSQNEKVLFSMGRLVPWKGFPLLIELIETLPEWRLVIAGDGPDRVALEAKVQKLGVAERVTFLGAIPHTDVLVWLRKTDAFVYNTHWESFSFQVLEALAAGTAIITTRVGSIPELVTDGIEGVLCTPDDLPAFQQAITSLITESNLWDTRRSAAKRKAARFGLDASVAEFVAALKKLCV